MVRMGLETKVLDGGTTGRGWWGDDGGWLPAPATTVRCECEVSGGDGFKFR
jgi:hypothetical protein